MHRALVEKISNQKAKIGIVGVGYVGLSLGIGFAKKGFKVYGIDINKKRVETLLKNQSFVLDIPDADIVRVRKEKKLVITSDFSVLREMDAVIICVPTPLDKHKEPDTSFISAAGQSIARYRRPGQVVVLQSTTYPGTTEQVLMPLLEVNGFKEGKNFFLAFAPERIDFGNKKFGLENTPKIVGGISPVSTEIARHLYAQVIRTIIPVSNARTAEMVKLLENTFRLVNIGLANEFMLTCEKMGIDVWEVIDAAKTKPYGFMPFYPGPGIGGHCIPVDPLYLSSEARSYGLECRFITTAYYLNLEMPGHVIRKITESLNERGKAMKRAHILLLGVAYKKDTSDLRESPALEILEGLIERGAKVSYHDPYVPSLKTTSGIIKSVPLSKKVLGNSDGVVIVADHSKVDYKLVVANSPLIVDTRNVLKGVKTRNSIVKI